MKSLLSVAMNSTACSCAIGLACGAVINALNALRWAFDTNLFHFIWFLSFDGMCHSSVEAIKFMKVDTKLDYGGGGSGWEKWRYDENAT